MHNYVSLNHADQIHTPQDDTDYKSAKIPESVTVEQLMRPISEMAIMPSNSSMKDIVLRMTESGYGVAVLVDKVGCVDAVISDGDLRRHAVKLFDQDPKTIATLSPVVVSPQDLIGSALKKIQTKKVYTILVTQNNKPVGLLRMHDLLRAGIT